MTEIPKLDKKGLRQFGLVTGGMVAGLFGIVLPLLFRHSFPAAPWAIAIVLWFWAGLAPRTLNPVYQVWMRIGLVLGWINTRIILGVIFYGLLVPMGLAMRGIFKQDPMRRTWEENLETYRIPSTFRSNQSMEKPF